MAADAKLDARTSACVATAWIILANKPIYPLYVWALLGKSAAWASCATLLLGPLYFATPWLARGNPWAARLALPLVGLADTLYATKVLGPAAGTELFLFACGLLAIVAFSAGEAISSRIITILVYLAALGLHGRYGRPLQSWTAEESARLFGLNVFAAASLMSFLGLRFAAVK